jgi:hypothetical protein
MALDSKVVGGVSGVSQDVDANHNALVTLPLAAAQAGFALAACEAAPASAPTGVLRNPCRASNEGRQLVGLDRPILYINFGGSATSANAIPQDALKQTATTLTATAGSPNNGFLRLNDGGGIANTTGIMYQTYATFPTYGGYGTRYEWMARAINANTVANKIIELGCFLATDAKTVGLLDGFCFRWTAAGEFRGYIIINGVEVAYTAALPVPSDNVVHRFTIIVNQDGVEFYVDKVLQAILAVPSDSCGTGLQPNLPMAMRLYYNAGVTLACKLEVAEMWVTQCGMDWNKPWPQICSGMQQHASNVPFGTAIGETTNQANGNATPAATQAGSNTTPNAAMAGLGGVFQMTAQASNVATGCQMIASYYQVPVQSATQGSKRLVVTGVRISALNYGATVAGTPTTLHWGLAWGGTGVSLAATDAVGTKAHRHLALANQSVAIGAIAGAMYAPDPIGGPLAQPIYVNPGEYFIVTVSFPIGTATGSQTVVYSIGVEGFWE